MIPGKYDVIRGMAPIVRRWKFRIVDGNNDSFYVDADGKDNTECEFIGTDVDAQREADRRADTWQTVTNSNCLRVVYESQGKVLAQVAEL
jgi:hypothetical protein